MHNLTKRNIWMAALSLVMFGVVSIFALSGAGNWNSKNAKKVSGGGLNYSLIFNASANKVDYGESTYEITTQLGNHIHFSYSGLSDVDSGWASIDEDGYFLNPYLSSEPHNAISGIQSIRVIYGDEEKTLSLSYGWLQGDEYEFVDHTLISNDTFDFGGYAPSYFEIRNLNEESVTIQEIAITYSCSASVPHVHDFEDEEIITPATCTESGEKRVICSECGETRIVEIPATGDHSWSNWVVVTPATCDSNGLKRRVCETCGHEEEVVIPKLNEDGEHEWGEWNVITAPTCVDVGLKQRVCSVCGEVENAEIPATGLHTYGEWTIDAEPTFDADGSKHHTCSVCGHTEYEDIPQLVCAYEITVDPNNGEDIEIIQLTEDGVYEIEDPVRVGYSFVKWVDENGDDFPSSGAVDADQSITAVYEILDTVNISQLVERAGAGADRIKLAADFEVNQTVCVNGSSVIYSEDDVTLTRADSFLGDIFVVGEDESGNNMLLDNVVPSLSLGEPSMLGTITIDGNKDNVSGEVAGSGVYLCNSGVLNMYDGVTLQNMKKTRNDRVLRDGETTFRARLGGSAILNFGGMINMYGGSVIYNEVNTTDLSLTSEEFASYYGSYGGAIASATVFNMYGGNIEYNKAARGGAIYAYITNNFVAGTISNNTATGVAGGIYAGDSSGTEIALGSTNGSGYLLRMENNSAGSSGGALYANGAQLITVLGHTLFSGNTAKTNGGAICTSARLYIEPASNGHVTFQSNTAGAGGAIYLLYSAGVNEVTRTQAILRYCAFMENTAKTGGAISLVGASLLLGVCTFTSNSATTSGGAMHFSLNDDLIASYCYVSGPTFNGNTAPEGGAWYMSRDCSAVLSSSQVYFRNNSSTGNGGAISSHGAIINFASSATSLAVFDNNTAGGNGGAFYLSYTTNSEDTSTGYDSSLSLTNVTITNNSATLGGVAYVTTKVSGVHTLDISGCIIEGNTSTSSGGALYLQRTTASIESTTFRDNTAASSGGAIYAADVEMNIESCSFEGNTATSTNGGAISAASSALLLGDTDFDGNSSGGSGGAIYTSASTTTIESGNFLNNVAHSDSYGGGAMYSTNSTLDISGAIYDGNQANLGGAIAAYSSSSVSLDGVEMTNNSALTSGGAMYIRNSSLLTKENASKTTIGKEEEGNYAPLGGAISVSVSSSSNSANVVLDNFDISYNSATNDNEIDSTCLGGAIYTSGVNITMSLSNSALSNNAAYNGAAIYTAGSGTSVTLSSTQVNSNSSTNAGALYPAGASSILTITDGSLSNNNAEKGAAIYVESTATLSLVGTEIRENSATTGGALYLMPVLNSKNVVTGHSSLSASNVTFDGNSASEGGAMYIRETCEATFSASTFSNNSSTGNGGAISSHGAIVTINQSSSFAGNDSSGGNGGALYLSYISAGSYDSSFTLVNTSFSSNSAGYGGALYTTTKVDDAEVLNVANCSFVGNTARTSGGAISTAASTINVESSSFSENIATANYGGAIYASGGVFSLDSCSFDANQANKGGGAIYTSSEATLESVDFTDNDSSASGGAMYVGANAEVTLLGGSFDGNVASTYGGALYVKDATLHMENYSLSENQSSDSGGAIYCAGSTLDISGSSFENNATLSSSYGGGAIYSTGSTSTIVDSSFVGNTSANNGGALAGYSQSQYHLGGIEAYDNVAVNYGGFAYVNKSHIATVDNAKTSYIGKMIEEVEHPNRAKYGGAFGAYSTGQTISLENMVIAYNVATTRGGAVSASDSSTLMVNGCSINYNSSPNGGAIYLSLNDGYTAAITDSSITYNTATSGNGGAIYAIGNTALTLNNCEIDHNTSTASNGGAIYLGGSATIDGTGGSISYNSASISGGALYMMGGVLANFVDTSVSNNSASSGGAIYGLAEESVAPALTAEGCSFNSNSTSASGGFGYFEGASSFTGIDCSISSNTAGGTGGAIYMKNTAIVSISGAQSLINGNSSASHGGAVYILNYARFSFSDGTISNNYTSGSSSNGGAIYVYNSKQSGEYVTTTFANCTISGNYSSAGNGHAVYVANYGSVSLAGVTGTGNGKTSGYGGFMYITSNAILNIDGLSLSGGKGKGSTPNIQVNKDTVVVTINLNASYSLNGTSLTTQDAISGLLSGQKGDNISYAEA